MVVPRPGSNIVAGMQDDRFDPPTNETLQEGDHQPDTPSDDPPSWAVTRREVLVGGASALAVGPVAAAQNVLDVVYEDATRQALIISWIDGSPKSPYQWRLPASAFTDPGSSNDVGRFVLRRTQNGWRADIAECSLPGGYRFGLRIDITWNPALGESSASLILTVSRPTKNVALKVQRLVEFLKSDQTRLAETNEIAGPIDRGEASTLTRVLFGETFDLTAARDIKLIFHHGGYWILRAGEKAPSGALEPAAARQNRFGALTGEGVALPFREVVFSVFSGGVGGNEATTAFALGINKLSDGIKEDVRALFAGAGAPPPTGSASDLRHASGSGSPPAAPALTRGGSPRGPSKGTPRVLYALVNQQGADQWRGTLAFGVGPGDESASLTLESSDTDKFPFFLGWRNAGDGSPVFAMRVGGALAILSESGARPTRFEHLYGQIWRAYDGDNVLRVAAALTPSQRDNYLDTKFGPFVVAPLPAIAPRPGVTSSVPPIRVGGTGRKGQRTLSHFAAPLALEGAGINVSSQRLAQLVEQSASADIAQAAVARATIPFSQLTFHEVECLFRIHNLPSQYPWVGPPPATDPPQAEAIVEIGATVDVEIPVRLSLSRATLLLRRPVDLLSLTYRFQDLLLERRGTGWFITPDRRIADFVPNGQPVPDPNVPLICKDQPTKAGEPTRYQGRTDPRPLMAVEFPPQHIAERAFFRQLQADPHLPLAPRRTDGVSTEPTDDEAEILRTGALNDRLRVRNAVSARQTQGLLPTDVYLQFQKDFAAAIDAENSNGRKVPADQKIYVGPAFLDLETARIARRVARASEASRSGPPANTPDERARIMRNVPEVELQISVTKDLLRQFKQDPNMTDAALDQQAVGASPDTDFGKMLQARDRIKKARDDTYAAFSDFFALNYPSLRQPFQGRRIFVAHVESIAQTNPGDAMAKAQAIAAAVAAFDQQNEDADSFEIPAEARVSGISRLVFRIPADDFEGGRPDARAGGPAGSFPFTIEALTNWGAFDLAVVRRAEKVFEPLAGWTPPPDPKGTASPPDIPDGRFPPRWARQETRDEAAKLQHQGITRGDAWSVRLDDQRALKGVVDCPLPLMRLGTIAAAQRMAEVVRGARAPGPFETSIEIPFRLMLSPAQDANWRSPLELPSELNLTPKGLPVPLWFAQLDELPGTSSLRAIWSPDFRPEALLDVNIGGLPHGPWSPWAMARDVTTRNPYKDKEPVQPYPGDPPPDPRAPEKFRTGMDAGDRHELVALTSLYGLPVRGRRDTNGGLTDGSQINPPPGFRIRHAELESLIDGGPKQDYSAIYRPQTLGVAELSLTAIGGSFDADTHFVPPASANIVATSLWKNPDTDLGQPLFDAFSVERWQQQTRLGRDIRVEVVYKGFLFPLGHRCSLVKLTERRFFAGPKGVSGGPVAFLIQRMFLRVGMPIKSYPGISQPNGGRSWAVETLEILTRVTPDIVDPTDATPGSDQTNPETASGRLFFPDPGNPGRVLPGLVFWPRVRARAGAEVKFELQVDQRGGRTSMPLIFVDNTAANSRVTIGALVDWYNGLTHDPLTDVTRPSPDDRCIIQLGGDKRRYAPEKEPDSTSFETRSWIVAVEGRENNPPDISPTRQFTFHNTNFDFGALLQGQDQPPFYPALHRARVHIGQVDRMAGRLTPDIDVFFDDEYKAFGFPRDGDLDQPKSDAQDRRAKTDVYLDFVDPVPLDPGRGGERTGGPVRPNTPLRAMSRSRGPVGKGPVGPGSKAVSIRDWRGPGRLPPLSTALMIRAPTLSSVATPCCSGSSTWVKCSNLFSKGYPARRSLRR
ncbi:MAG: hypothetical protein U1E81_21400 [Xanthobacteraceae bacterium]